MTSNGILSKKSNHKITFSPHVLVVDDDDRLRDLLKRYLAENGYRVTTASSAAEARIHLKGLEFDIMVLDVMMPGESGTNLTKSLRKKNDIPVLLLTAMGEPKDRISGLESGADDYLTKPFEPRELLLRLAGILRRTDQRGNPESKSSIPLQLGTSIFDPKNNTLTKAGESIRLTRSEIDLLNCFALRPDETITRDELCEYLGIANSGRALDVQITRLRRKVEPNHRDPQYLKTIWGAGYLMRSDRG